MPRRRIPVTPRAERVLDAALDRALAIERPLVRAYLDRLRARDPHASPAQLIAALEKHYRTAAVGIGAASGGAAALPGIGTASSIAAGGAEIAAFVSATAMYVLALAELHQVPVANAEVRRALVLWALVGTAGEGAVEEVAAGGRPWALVINRPDQEGRLGGVNARLGRLLLTRFGVRQGALLVGRAIPMGIGAGVGALGNAALARGAIAAARRAFGPPPAELPPRVVDAT